MQFQFTRSLLVLLIISFIPVSSFAIGPIVVGRHPIILEDDNDTIVLPNRPILPRNKPAPKPKTKPIIQTNKVLIRNFYNEIWVKNNNEAIFTYLDKDVNGYINSKHYYINDFNKKIQRYQARHKDISVEIKSLVEEQNKVASYVMVCATKIGETKKECVSHVGIFTIKNHKISEFVVNMAFPKPDGVKTVTAEKPSWMKIISQYL